VGGGKVELGGMLVSVGGMVTIGCVGGGCCADGEATIAVDGTLTGGMGVTVN
jgi:hypothetical protein